jgi:hypothetical protein
MKENMPQQYKKFMEYVAMKENNYSEKDKVLLSVNM